MCESRCSLPEGNVHGQTVPQEQRLWHIRLRRSQD